MFEDLGQNNTRETTSSCHGQRPRFSHDIIYGCSKVIKSPRIPLCFLPFFPCVGFSCISIYMQRKQIGYRGFLWMIPCHLRFLADPSQLPSVVYLQTTSLQMRPLNFWRTQMPLNYSTNRHSGNLSFVNISVDSYGAKQITNSVVQRQKDSCLIHDISYIALFPHNTTWST